MTLTVDIKPELARQAEQHGVGLGAYAARLLEVAAHPAENQGFGPQPLEVTLRKLIQIPSLPDDAFSRESISRDHD